MIAKPISIKDAERKFGGCARKAVELIAGELLRRGLQTAVSCCGQMPQW